MKQVAFLFLLPLFCTAQGVRLSQYDVFVKKHRIEMEAVPLLSSSSAKLTVTLSSVASDLFVQFTGAGWGAVTIDDGNELLLQFTNESAVTLKADGLQTFEPGIPQSTYRHRYRVTREGVEALARNGLAAIRKYSFKEASDIRIPRESGTKLQRQSTAFLAELQRTSAILPLKRIQAKDVLEHIGDSVQFCSKVYNVGHTAAVQEKSTVVNLQTNFSEPVVNLVIAEEDRAKFGEAPDVDFINKEICVSGLLQLRNNVPTMVVSRKEQLTAKTQVTSPPGK